MTTESQTQPPMKRREPDQGDPNVHFVLDIKVIRVESKVSGADVRVTTELGHIVLSEKVLGWLLRKGTKALELIGE